MPRLLSTQKRHQNTTTKHTHKNNNHERTTSKHQSELNWLMNKLWELGWKGFSEEEVQRAINIRDKNNQN